MMRARHPVCRCSSRLKAAPHPSQHTASMNGNNGNILDRAEVDKLLAQYYKMEGIAPKHVEILSGSNKGDGYLSFLTRADITTEDGRKVYVIMKSALRIEEFRKVAPIHDAFLREMFFYETILPQFIAFQAKFHVAAPFNTVPKYFLSCKDEGHEVLLMENIRTAGFQLWDRMKYMDHEHIQLVMKTYGKFHAVSYAMKLHDSQQFDALAKQVPDVFRADTMDPSMFEMFRGSALRVQGLFKDDDPVIYESMEKFVTGVQELWATIQDSCGEHPVILHGDCWVNNMMFKYDDLENPGRPTDIRLIDFQIVKLGSPVMDLSYFFYVSAPKAILDQLDVYLGIYHDSLRVALTVMDAAEHLISFEQLKDEWKQFSRFGYMMSLIVSRVMMSEEDEVFDLANLAAEKALAGAFNKEMKHDGFINNKLKTLTQHMHQNGFI